MPNLPGFGQGGIPATMGIGRALPGLAFSPYALTGSPYAPSSSPGLATMSDPVGLAQPNGAGASGLGASPFLTGALFNSLFPSAFTAPSASSPSGGLVAPSSGSMAPAPSGFSLFDMGGLGPTGGGAPSGGGGDVGTATPGISGSSGPGFSVGEAANVAQNGGVFGTGFSLPGVGSISVPGAARTLGQGLSLLGIANPLAMASLPFGLTNALTSLFANSMVDPATGLPVAQLATNPGIVAGSTTFSGATPAIGNPNSFLGGLINSFINSNTPQNGPGINAPGSHPFGSNGSYVSQDGTIYNSLNVPTGRTQFCFTADTPVLMADGSWKCIEKIRVGDRVRCYDWYGIEETERAITHISKHTPVGEMLYSVNGIRVTGRHRFATGYAQWKPAAELERSDVVLGPSGECVRIRTIDTEPLREPVFNLCVDRLERTANFYVADPFDHIYLVHNGDSGGDGPGGTGDAEAGMSGIGAIGIAGPAEGPAAASPANPTPGDIPDEPSSAFSPIAPSTSKA